MRLALKRNTLLTLSPHAGTVMALHLFHFPPLPPPASKSRTTSSRAAASSTSEHSPPSSSAQPPPSAPSLHLHLLIGYESGHLALFRFSPTASFARLATRSEPETEVWAPKEGKMVEESEGWELVWSEKGHRDAGAFNNLLLSPCAPFSSTDTTRAVMSLAVTRDLRFAFTVAADHFICKYRIFDVVRPFFRLLHR